MTGTATVYMLDGPCQDLTFTYGQPLPKVLVVPYRSPVGVRWHDYQQTVHSNRYRHDARCKCFRPAVPIHNLDASSA